MNRESVNWWIALLANIGVLGGLLFVGYEVRQNTSQLRAEGSRSVTEMVNYLNAATFSDAELTAILEKGMQSFESLDAIERARFESYQFARLNIADYIMDLEGEGISDLSFRYVDYIISDFNKYPGLQAFIRTHRETFVGSPELLRQLLGEH